MRGRPGLSGSQSLTPRFGVSAWIYGDAPLPETLGRIAAAGYDGVELPGEPERWRPGDLRRWLGDHGLAPVALTASCMTPTERDLAHPDPRIRGVAVDYVRRCLGLAAEIGAPLVQMLASGEPRLAPLATRDAEWAWSVAGMQAAAREAERVGVAIAVEPLNRYEGYLVTSTAEALAYLDAVASPWVGMTLDLFHANIEEPSVAGAIRAAGARLWHVQAADTTRRGLGTRAPRPRGGDGRARQHRLPRRDRRGDHGAGPGSLPGDQGRALGGDPRRGHPGVARPAPGALAAGGEATAARVGERTEPVLPERRPT